MDGHVHRAAAVNVARDRGRADAPRVVLPRTVTSGVPATGLVEQWFREFVGEPIESRATHDGREWCIRIEHRSDQPLLVQVTKAALDLDRAELLGLLAGLAHDARTTPPEPPGHYLVTIDGVSVRGMIRFAWEAYGQSIRCFICSRVAKGENEPDPQEWRVSVDYADRGAVPGASSADDRKTIMRLAIAHLERVGGIRIPQPPWSWSVIDAGDVEWWGRLESTDTGDRLLLSNRSNRREYNIAWDSALRAPTAAELRTLVSRFRRG
jgi:hypothetical protein